MKKLALLLLLIALLVVPAVAPMNAAALGGGLSVTTNPAGSITGTSAQLHGAASTGGTAPEPVQVWFNYGDGGMLTNSTSPQRFGAAPASFSASISGLSPGLTYSFQAVIMPDLIGSAPILGNVLNFTTTALPPTQVATLPATSISSSSATLNGNLVTLGSQSSCGVGFEWGTTTGYGNTTPLQNRSAPGGFSYNLTGLAPGTYHYRSFATVYGGSAQSVFGADEVFQLSAPLVSVMTQGAAGISSTSVILTGTIASMGGFPSVQGWFEWGPGAFTNSSNPQNLTVGGDYGVTLTGLQPSSTYLYRAAARGNAAGTVTSYGETRLFSTTAAPALAVQTRNATSISGAAANLNGTLLSLGGAGLVQVAFEWGTTTGYGNVTSPQNMTGPADYAAPLSGLAPGSTYYFRAVVRTLDNVSYGGGQSFTTSSSPPPGPGVETATATEVKTGVAVLNGKLLSLGSYGTVRTWFEYGRDAGYGSTTQPSIMNGPGPFSAAVSGLQPNTVYYYRTVVQPVSGGLLAYGAALNFTTPAQASPEPPKPVLAAPVVSSSGASNLTSTTATLGGSLASLGSAASVQVYFEWGADTRYGNTTPVQLRTSPGAFTAGIAGLTPGATNHYRVVAVALGGDGKPVYSTDMAFATAPKSGC